MSQAKTGILLANLGTPEAPTPAAVKRYLRQFLSDTRVVDTQDCCGGHCCAASFCRFVPRVWQSSISPCGWKRARR